MISYFLLTTLLWPVFASYTVKLAWRYKSLRYLKQRLGFSCPHFATRPIWIHCASVGEVNTARALIQLLIDQYPQQKLLITTNTVTGALVVDKSASTNCYHCYLPIDTYGSVKRFLEQTQPKLALIMETELWPQLYRQCHKRNVPICIINARLSAKTLNSNSWIKARYRDALDRVDHVLCRSSDDQQAYIQLGMAESKTDILGNLKFAQAMALNVKAINALNNRPYVLAASTHNNEEFQLSKIWTGINTHNRLLVIAPRHPERAQSILEQLRELNVNVARRSIGDTINNVTDIYLADTIGELSGFINSAELVVMGGSLIPHGGQNLLEPASLGKAIIVGPHMENFAAETALLLSHQACIQVSSAQELAVCLQDLLADAGKRAQLGKRARDVVLEQSHIAEKYLHKIATFYAPQLAS